MASPKGQVKVQTHGKAAVEVLGQAAQGLLFPSESDAPLEPFLWPADAPAAPTAALVAQHAKVEPQTIKTQSLTAFFKPAVTEEEWHNEEEKAEVKRFQALLQVVKSTLKTPRVFRVGEVEVAVYLVGQVADGYAGLRTEVVET